MLFLQLGRMTKRFLLSSSLLGDSLGGLPGGFRIPKVVVPQGLQAVVKFVNQRNSGGNVQLDNGVVRNVVEIFHERPE